MLSAPNETLSSADGNWSPFVVGESVNSLLASIRSMSSILIWQKQNVLEFINFQFHLNRDNHRCSCTSNSIQHRPGHKSQPVINFLFRLFRIKIVSSFAEHTYRTHTNTINFTQTMRHGFLLRHKFVIAQFRTVICYKFIDFFLSPSFDEIFAANINYKFW